MRTIDIVKNAIRLTIAGAFAIAPCSDAQNNSVRVAGYLNYSIEVLEGNVGTGDRNRSLTDISSNGSSLTLSGSEDLGLSLMSKWQVQTFFSAGGTGNSDPVYRDELSNGVTFLGLSGSFGQVRLGKLETPFKVVGRDVDLFNSQLGDSRNIIAPGTATGAGGDGLWNNTWDLRANNTVAYTSPHFSGFEMMGAYVTNLNSGSNSAKSDAATSIYSVNATYAAGPVFVGIGYEEHETLTSVSPEALRVAGSYAFGAVKFVALWQTTRNNGGVVGNDRAAWGLGMAFKTSNRYTLKLQYYETPNMRGVVNTYAAMLAVGLDYELSRRTTLYTSYAQVNNGGFAQYSPFGGSHGDNPGSAIGQASRGISVGIAHQF